LVLEVGVCPVAARLAASAKNKMRKSLPGQPLHREFIVILLTNWV
jgi:hypothetical protein